MLRQGFQHLRVALAKNAPGAAAEQLVTTAGSGTTSFSSASLTLSLLQRAFHSGVPRLGTTLPHRPELFQSVLRKDQPGTLWGSVFRRLMSSEKKPGFERLRPKRAVGEKENKKGIEQELKRAMDAAGGGGGAGGGGKDAPEGDKFGVVNLNWFVLGTTLLLGYFAFSGASGGGGAGVRRQEISFQDFYSRLLSKGQVARLEVVNNSLVRVYVKSDGVMDDFGPSEGTFRYYFQIGSVEAFERKMDEAQASLGVPASAYVPVKYTQEVSVMKIFWELAPSLFFIGITLFLINRQMRNMSGFGGIGGRGGLKGGRGGGGGPMGGLFGMTKANTSTIEATKEKMTFKDVAGCDEAKQEIMEFVDFLKNPNKYKELGAKIPKGALLVGPPGTGKTLLAKATAGEAGVPFLSISGSDFMEMFVGVGPARVRDLFSQARSQSPSIIFIDEIDAIGRQRGRSGAMGGGHDERENTLNQLLVEMDGFSTTSGVVVLAGTNRPDILDKALLRPGRFDRTITVDTPDIKGREQIFRVHLARLKLVNSVDYYAERLAALTPGMSGADIANVCNEGALVAARYNKTAVDMSDFESAIDRVIGGLEKKNKVISQEEKRTVAVHESGHAVVSWFLEHAEPLLKVSIVPRGTSVLGFAQYLPNERLLMSKEQLLDSICALLGGRAAEQVILGRVTTGAVNDLERVTQMAYNQVAVFGMNDKIGLLSYRMNQDAFDKPYSNETAHLIDSEVRAFVDTAYKRTIQLVEDHKQQILDMTSELLTKEVIGLDDVERLLGKRPYTSAEKRNIDRYRQPSTPEYAPASDTDTASPDSSSSEGDSSRGASPSPPNSPPPSDGEDGSSGGQKGPQKPKRRLDPGVVIAT